MAEHPFTDDQVKKLQALAAKEEALLEMAKSFDFYGRLGRLVWKVGVTIGGTVAAFAAFKDQVISLFKWG